MSTYLLVAFLFLFGIFGLVNTQLPHWIVPLAALAAGVALVFDGKWKGRSQG